MNEDLSIAVIQRTNLARFLAGDLTAEFRHIDALFAINRKLIRKDEVLAAIWNVDKRLGNVRPDIIVIPDEQLKEWLAWISTYQADFSPLSQWCRVMGLNQAKNISSQVVTPEFYGLEAAWAGAVIGEIIARRGVDLPEISLVWCVSSATFAFARASALWADEVQPESILADISEAQKLLRAEPRRDLVGLSDIWRILDSLSRPSSKTRSRLNGAQQIILDACRQIQKRGKIGFRTYSDMAKYLPILEMFREFDEIDAEDRVRMIDAFVDVATEVHELELKDEIEILSFIIGYAIGRVGGGEGNLDLLRPFHAPLPLASVWCPAIAALHRPVNFSAALDGLGRLVVKQLVQPLYLSQLPTADICLQELRSLINMSVNYRKLPFRPAGARVAMVEICPGVDIAVSLRSEWHGKGHSQQRNETQAAAEQVAKNERNLVRQMTREIEGVLEKYSERTVSKRSVTKRKTKRNNDPKLL